MTGTGPDAAYFDAWYADMQADPGKDEIQRRHLGLPPELLSTSLLNWDGIAEVTAALRLSPGATVLDLACGRGGYGTEVARRRGSRLVGVDFSAAALQQASALSRSLGGRFVVGRLEATGLRDRAVDSVMCVDAIQFADPPHAAYDEMLRVLKPGGRVVLTCWEAVDADDDVPPRLRTVRMRNDLACAGFTEIEVRDRPDWRAAERAMWEEAAALDPKGDPALRSFHDEGVRSLATFGSLRRRMATATAPV
ncbi:MAG TPA: class I SAM-dependent methyltransferase [Nocardioidaceae bacterium]|nr:class I SAM-dependent methyltransferase [Nocardioidaceae bacterium]